VRGHDLTIEAARSAGLRVGILTNGPSAWQRRKLELTGIGDAVDAVAISAELGAAKPDPPRSTAPASCWAWRPG
jgi:putative hydrolase of the HAD superfamily